jgi:hypothetical protein
LHTYTYTDASKLDLAAVILIEEIPAAHAGTRRVTPDQGGSAAQLEVNFICAVLAKAGVLLAI